MFPRLAIGAAEQAGRLGIAGHFLLRRIVREGSTNLLARMQLAVEMWPCSMSATGRLRFSIAARKSSKCRRVAGAALQFDGLFGHVFGICSPFVEALEVDRLRRSCRCGMKSRAWCWP
jgi:hypothetical protein